MTESIVPIDVAPSLRSQIERTIRIIHPSPNNVFEIRVLGVPVRGRPHQAAGYFDDPVKAAAEALRYETLQPSGIYLTLNSVDTALLARSCNRIRNYLEPVTSDANVVRRRWLPIDIDATPVAGISATDEERDAASQAAHDVEAWLSAHGWRHPLIGDSGNGYWLLYPIDLPNDERATALCKQVIETLHVHIGDSIYPARIDRSVFNAARICRLFGTMNRKGDSTPDRPHRRSELFPVPEEIA